MSHDPLDKNRPGPGQLHNSYNILLTPKVSDFGLAKSLGDEAGLTRTSSIIGSPSYMAPEQARGLAGLVGPATDVYALGAILYELLTGRPPFRAATVLATLEQVKGAEPPAPCRLQPGLSVDIETITLKCLVKEPSRRYGSAAELADDLARFDAGRPVRARPIGWLGRSAKWARRRPATASLAVASTLSVVLLIAVLSRANLAARHQQRLVEGALERESAVRRELADANARLAGQQRLLQQALDRTTFALGERDSDLQRERLASYWQRIALAEAERRDGRTAEAGRALDSCPEDLRGWEWRFLRRGDPPRPLVGHGGEVWDAVFGPDGRTVATAGFDNTVRTWDRTTGAPKLVLRGHTERVYSVAFNRDGAELISASADRTAIVWNLATGRPRLTLTGHTDNVRCAAFNPDGGMIATGSWDGSLRIWSRNDGRLQRTCAARVGYITRLAFSPDGLRLVAGGSDGSAEVWDYVRGRCLQRFSRHPGPVLGVAFSPDGLSVAAASNEAGGGLIRVWEVATGQESLSLRDEAGLIERVVFSPDGRRLASSGWNGTVSLWDARSGRLGLVLRGHADRVWGLNFSPSGDALATASADGKALIWEAGHPSP